MGTYPTQQTDKNIVLHGTPVGWLAGVRFDEDTGAVVVAPTDPTTALTDPDDFRLLFNNIKKANGKVTMKGAESTSGEYIDIEAADNAITRFPKVSRITDGTDDTQILTDPTKDENATAKGEITLELNQADMDRTSWTGFLKYLYENKDGFWFICVPTGFNYHNRYIADVKKADGYIYMLAKISSDIEWTAENAPATLSVSFVSYKFASSSSLFATSMAYSVFGTPNYAFGTLRLMGTEPYVSITPEVLSVEESEDIAKGIPVFKISA